MRNTYVFTYGSFLIGCLFFSTTIFAQNLPNVVPSSPQVGTFQVQQIGVNPTGRTTSTVGMSSNTRYQQQRNQYEQDRLKVQQQQEKLKALYKELEVSKSIRYSLPIQNRDARANYYYKAFDSLQKMNPDNFSIKEATFIIENAFYDNKKSYDDFQSVITSTGTFIKEVMHEQKLDATNIIDVNQSIFAFMTDTITVNGKTHYPYTYDFNDYMGRKNWDNMFVHKLMFQGSGQCNSMPRYYLILAEELNTESYLALAPKHSFIRFVGEEGEWHNAELTSGAIMTDNFMLQSGYMKSEAINNENYMTAQTNKQVMAQLLNDLASGYISKFGNDGFVSEIIEKSLELNPNGMMGNLHKMKYQIAELSYVMQQLGVSHPNQLQSYPKAVDMLNGLVSQDQKLRNMGYEEMPQERYEAWLAQLEEEKQKEEAKELQNNIKQQTLIKN